MSEKIILNKSYSKIKGVKLNEMFELSSPSDEAENRQKEIEIELHNQFINGFKEGQKEAINRLQKEFAEKLKEAYSLLDSINSKIDSQLSEQMQRINEFILNLSFEISEKILRREIERETPVYKIIEESLKKLSSANDITIKLNPDDLNKVENHLSTINKKLSSGNIKFEADERVEKGGCLIESEIGNADGRISSQIENLKRQIETYFEENNA